MKDPYDIIDTVRLTEKSTLLGDGLNQYVFRVNPKANKVEIKWAVETIFKKTVLRVNTAQYAGKKKRERRPDAGRTAHWKKAIVTLKEGDKIDIA